MCGLISFRILARVVILSLICVKGEAQDARFSCYTSAVCLKGEQSKQHWLKIYPLPACTLNFKFPASAKLEREEKQFNKSIEGFFQKLEKFATGRDKPCGSYEWNFNNSGAYSDDEECFASAVCDENGKAVTDFIQIRPFPYCNYDSKSLVFLESEMESLFNRSRDFVFQEVRKFVTTCGCRYNKLDRAIDEISQYKWNPSKGYEACYAPVVCSSGNQSFENWMRYPDPRCNSSNVMSFKQTGKKQFSTLLNKFFEDVTGKMEEVCKKAFKNRNVTEVKATTIPETTQVSESGVETLGNFLREQLKNHKGDFTIKTMINGQEVASDDFSSTESPQITTTEDDKFVSKTAAFTTVTNDGSSNTNNDVSTTNDVMATLTERSTTSETPPVTLKTTRSTNFETSRNNVTLNNCTPELEITTTPVVGTDPRNCYIGLSTGEIPPSQFSASSTHRDCPIQFAALESDIAWCALRKEVGQWIQVDLGETKQIFGIATQGRKNHPQWVKTYQVAYGDDPSSPCFVTEQGKNKTFIGNSNQNTIVSARFSHSLTTRYVRIYPVTFHRWMSMRIELLEC